MCAAIKDKTILVIEISPPIFKNIAKGNCNEINLVFTEIFIYGCLSLKCQL